MEAASKGVNSADGPAKRLHERLRRHRRRAQRHRHRSALPGRAFVPRPRWRARRPAFFGAVRALATRTCRSTCSPEPRAPLFYSNRGAGLAASPGHAGATATARAPATSSATIGESSGYSCAKVELTDYAPPGELCGGPCSPTWVTVAGPDCIAGDSGGPVFSGGVAFGIAKGVNRTPDGRCIFYYYMSTDYLPPPWRLMVAAEARRPRPGRRASDREPGTGSAASLPSFTIRFLRVDMDDARLQRARFGIVEHRIAHDDHEIAGMDEMRCCAVDPDHSAARARPE